MLIRLFFYPSLWDRYEGRVPVHKAARGGLAKETR